MAVKVWRNGKPVKARVKENIVTIPPYFKWYKPWTWRNGSRKGDVFTVLSETYWPSEGE